MAELLAALAARHAVAFADDPIDEFGSLAAVLAVSPERLGAITGQDIAQRLGAFYRALLHSVRPQALAAPVFPNTAALLAYLRLQLAEEPIEQVRVLFLDARNRLIRNEVLAKGTLTGAVGLVLVHNHPTGDPMRSAADLAATRDVAIRRYDAAETLFYLDPPYWGCETDYGDGFARDDFERLADQLAAIAGRFVLSINDTPGARAVFSRFRLEVVPVTYTVCSNRGTGQRASELIVTNG